MLPAVQYSFLIRVRVDNCHLFLLRFDGRVSRSILRPILVHLQPLLRSLRLYTGRFSSGSFTLGAAPDQRGVGIAGGQRSPGNRTAARTTRDGRGRRGWPAGWTRRKGRAARRATAWWTTTSSQCQSRVIEPGVVQSRVVEPGVNRRRAAATSTRYARVIDARVVRKGTMVKTRIRLTRIYGRGPRSDGSRDQPVKELFRLVVSLLLSFCITAVQHRQPLGDCHFPTTLGSGRFVLLIVRGIQSRSGLGCPGRYQWLSHLIIRVAGDRQPKNNKK